MNMRRMQSALLTGCLTAALPVLAETTTPVGATYQTGYDSGYEIGYSAGLAAGAQQCSANPAACGISFAALSASSAWYGETEPNDNIVAADPLAVGAGFRAQSYGATDQDWFYVVTTAQNMNLTLNFSMPDMAVGSLAGWVVSIRDAIGMTFTEFNTGYTVVDNSQTGVDYKVTLGLAGTYYVVVKPAPDALNYYQYQVRVNLEHAANTSPNYVVGFYDAESEPNNDPTVADVITRGVSMYGLINLQFNVPVAGETYTWGQGEADWYVYESRGNEIAQLSFCDRQNCSEGNWSVQIFDQAHIDALRNDPNQSPGTHSNDAYDAAALVTFNTTLTTGTDTTSTTTPEVWRIGLDTAGKYYMRVNHKRKLDAPCTAFALDMDNNGVPDSNANSCGCTSGYNCKVKMTNPSEPSEHITNTYPPCPNGTGGGDSAHCQVQCLSQSQAGQADMTGDGIPDGAACNCPSGTFPCAVNVPNPGTPAPTNYYPKCPDGTNGGTIGWCNAQCLVSNSTGRIDLNGDNVPDGESCTCAGDNFPCPYLFPDGSLPDGATASFYPTCPNGSGDNSALCDAQCLIGRGAGVMDTDGDGLPGKRCTSDMGDDKCLAGLGIMDTDGDGQPNSEGLPRYSCYCPSGQYPCTTTNPDTAQPVQCLAGNDKLLDEDGDNLPGRTCDCSSDDGFPCSVAVTDANGVSNSTEGRLDTDGDKLPDGDNCTCANGVFPCPIVITKTLDPVPAGATYPKCANGTGGTQGDALCTVQCLVPRGSGIIDTDGDGLPGSACIGNAADCLIGYGIMDTDGDGQQNSPGLPRYVCYCPSGDYPCDVTNPDDGKTIQCLASNTKLLDEDGDNLPGKACDCPNDSFPCDTIVTGGTNCPTEAIYPTCPNGTGGGTTTYCDMACIGGTVAIEASDGKVDANANAKVDTGETVACQCKEKYSCPSEVKLQCVGGTIAEGETSAIDGKIDTNGNGKTDSVETNDCECTDAYPCPVDVELQCVGGTVATAAKNGTLDANGNGVKEDTTETTSCGCSDEYPCSVRMTNPGTPTFRSTCQCLAQSPGQMDMNGDGFGEGAYCDCPTGAFPCEVQTPNPGTPTLQCVSNSVVGSYRCLLQNPGRIDSNKDGIMDGGYCDCPSGGFPCDIKTPNPGTPTLQCVVEIGTAGVIDLDGNGLADTGGANCGCPLGDFPCSVRVQNPGTATLEGYYPLCPDGTGGGDTNRNCAVQCLSTSQQGYMDMNGDGLTDGTACNCPNGQFPCTTTARNPAAPDETTTYNYPVCPDGSGGGENAQCEVGCACATFGGTVEMPEGDYTSQYNFSWMTNVRGSQPTTPSNSTSTTDAYQDYTNRPSAY